MNYNIIWSGLADKNYYNVIAQYCLPSWSKLPGDKKVISDTTLSVPSIECVPWDPIPNKDSKFLKINPSKKSWNFWKKMQSQIWAVRKYKGQCDFVVLLDTDIEVLDFNLEMFNSELEKFLESGYIWATGESNRKGHDSGFIVLNTKHPLIDELTDFYENIWETNKIFELAKGYDGHAVESMFSTYPSYKIKNRDYGAGLHVYELGLVHYGSKIPKALRAEWKGDGKSLVEKRLSEIVIKKYKGE